MGVPGLNTYIGSVRRFEADGAECGRSDSEGEVGTDVSGREKDRPSNRCRSSQRERREQRESHTDHTAAKLEGVPNLLLVSSSVGRNLSPLRSEIASQPRMTNDAGDVELRRELVSTEFLDPRRDFTPTALSLEVRWDPLTGQTSRILPPSSLLRRSEFDLAALAEETQHACPFCSERIEQATPKLLSSVAEDGRIRRGEAVLFPNLLPYSKHSSVSVYSPRLHFLPLEAMTGALVADNLGTQVEFVRAVVEHDHEAHWASVNANHMLPSGSSLFHPHLQGSVNPYPTTAQRLLAAVPAERFTQYVDAEKRQGHRYLGSTGRVEWLTSFAPLGPAELRAFVFGIASPGELDDDLIQELGDGISQALHVYAELDFQSFNLAVYGALPRTRGYPLNLRLVCRSNLEPLYRSDATWLERLHWEAAIDISPEELAERARPFFSTG